MLSIKVVNVFITIYLVLLFHRNFTIRIDKALSKNLIDAVLKVGKPTVIVALADSLIDLSEYEDKLMLYYLATFFQHFQHLDNYTLRQSQHYDHMLAC